MGREGTMYSERTRIYRRLEQERGSKVLAYITGDRDGLETTMAADVHDLFTHHLDAIGDCEKLSLVLYTRGGDTLSAWSLANLLRSFCKYLEVIIPARCLSAGTLLSLSADKLVMTKQATLGPIDPSVNTPLNPELPGRQPAARMPVSVEDVNAFLEQARESLGKDSMVQAFDRLAKTVHPLVLGQAYRVRAQIRMLGERLLSSHLDDRKTINAILDFLCSESGSHDYTINRKEARERLGLPIENPSKGLYGIIQNLYEDIVADLELAMPYNINAVFGDAQQCTYSFRRALIESVEGGSHVFTTEGTLSRSVVQSEDAHGFQVSDERMFDGWRYHPNE